MIVLDVCCELMTPEIACLPQGLVAQCYHLFALNTRNYSQTGDECVRKFSTIWFARMFQEEKQFLMSGCIE